MNRRKSSGFTLIEILVVISIIALLAGILVVGLGKARSGAKVKATKLLLQQIKGALSTYRGPEDFGRFPPTSLEDIGVEVANQTNLGAEALVACLLTQMKNGVYLEFDSKKLVNTDEDTVENFNDSVNKSGEAYEYADAFGQPLIYINALNYANYAKYASYKNRSGKEFSIKPIQDPKTKNFVGNGRYQLWSVGPNGKNENGKGDDIVLD